MYFFLSTTLSFIVPELVRSERKRTSVVIYSIGISIFEILSDLDSPWENVESFASDSMLRVL